MELCYAPPYGSAKDPVNYAGFVASNIFNGHARICHVPDVENPLPNQKLLDVRSPAELQAGTIPGAINISIDELRNRLDELSKEKEYLVFCAVGLRGYLACRILIQHGFKCRNLSGGYKTYCAVEGIQQGNDSPRNEMKNDTGQIEEVVQTSTDIVETIDACGLQCPTVRKK